jgi:hypothetical protein
MISHEKTARKKKAFRDFIPNDIGVNPIEILRHEFLYLINDLLTVSQPNYYFNDIHANKLQRNGREELGTTRRHLTNELRFDGESFQRKKRWLTVE